MLPSLVVPGLVGPFANVVIAADACRDACVRAGEGRGIGAAGRFSDIRSGWRSMCGSRGLNDWVWACAELLVVALGGG